MDNLCEFFTRLIFLAELCVKLAEDAVIFCCTGIIVFAAFFINGEFQLFNSLVIAAEVDVFKCGFKIDVLISVYLSNYIHLHKTEFLI